MEMVAIVYSIFELRVIGARHRPALIDWVRVRRRRRSVTAPGAIDRSDLNDRLAKYRGSSRAQAANAIATGSRGLRGTAR
jgi:hypothetical protein